MRYTNEYKLMCVNLFKEGVLPETPEGISRGAFRRMVWTWLKMAEAHGQKILDPGKPEKILTTEEKFELVSKALAGESQRSLSIEAGIGKSTLNKWVKRYKLKGYQGLAKMQSFRLPKEVRMPKKNTPEPLTETEREELIRLRAECEYLKKKIQWRKEVEEALQKLREQTQSNSCGNNEKYR